MRTASIHQPSPRLLRKLAPTFRETVAQAELSLTALAREAGVAVSTIQALVNPAQQPGRIGGMQRTTAWKLANAFARHAQVSPAEAYRLLIVEVPYEAG
ncbi:hypothetical protein [Candidatus Chloroploca sp. Khr17]|uniref:hypothetical protein n=1 Tax=Candidatus Chloroploca sp. Khr17 TaxID=2496869 RepID=UPI00101BDCE3|nr:hypothetical protein [Candidatus Chloroploca sp. Khr17]